MRTKSSKFAARSFKLFAPGALALGLTATCAGALTINDSFLSTFQPTTNTAALEAAIQSASNAIGSLFSNPITVNILFQTNSSVVGQSDTGLLSQSYGSYRNLLTTNSSANPANSILSTAVANLSSGNGSGVSGANVVSTSANLRALGVSPTIANGQFDNHGNFVGSSGTYDSVITLNSSLMNLSTNGAIAVIQHEVDEVLGGGGAGSMIGLQSTLQSTFGTGTYYGSTDLYRYSQYTPSFTTNTSTTSYFSVDGGHTSIVSFNQSGGGSDYGDFGVGTCLIQSAYYCGSITETYGTSSPEYAMLESIGYDPVATPLPSTWFMLLSGFVGFGFFAHRGTKKNAAALAA